MVAADGGFEGGVIAPGINLSMQALHDAAVQAAARRHPATRSGNRVIGTGTRSSAMQSGVFWGYISLIEGLVGAHQAPSGARPSPSSAPAASPRCFEGATDSRSTASIPDLTIRGMLEIWRRSAHMTKLNDPASSAPFA